LTLFFITVGLENITTAFSRQRGQVSLSFSHFFPHVAWK
jgi:hypothetical protein